MARFEGYGPSAYREKNAGKPVEDYVSKINGREGTKTVDPSKLKHKKKLTKKERERLAQYDEQ